MSRKVAGITDEAVRDATDRTWDEWLDLLDAHDGTDLTHRERVAVISEAGIDSGWWQQQLAVGYERERGLREVGETADAGFEVGVQRTLEVRRDDLWELVMSPRGLAAWLGEIDELEATPGSTYETADGCVGEVRTIAPGERIRLTWQPPGREQSTTLQLTLSVADSSDDKTVLRFHHERLADGDEREAMRQRWTAAAERIRELE